MISFAFVAIPLLSPFHVVRHFSVMILLDCHAPYEKKTSLHNNRILLYQHIHSLNIIRRTIV